MENKNSPMIPLLFSFAPYAAVSLVYMYVRGEGWRAFGEAILALFLARTFFSVIEGLGGILMWRTYGKKRAIQDFLTVLREGNLPKRQYSNHSFMDYLGYLDADPNISPEIRTTVKEISLSLKFAAQGGMLSALRIHSAAEEAFSIYSPESEAPIYKIGAT